MSQTAPVVAASGHEVAVIGAAGPRDGDGASEPSSASAGAG
ncbi:MAG: hypothetical protein ACT4PW_03575 [Acidimicrobiia bacterium]